MNEKDFKAKFRKDLIVDAEIFSTWYIYLNLEKFNQKIFTLGQSIIFKLQQSYFHLIHALRNSQLAINELNKIPSDRQYYNFVTNCHIDSMMYALNSLMDVIAKLLNEIYSEKIFKCKYFTDFKTEPELLETLKTIDTNTAEIIQSFSNLEEREYVRVYCNENKHQRAFFSAASYFDVDIDTTLDKVEIIKGYNLKNRYKRSTENKELSDYTPKLFNVHLEKINELGKSILSYKGLEPFPIDENFLKYLDRMNNRYYR